MLKQQISNDPAEGWILASRVRLVLKMVLDELDLEAEIFPKQDSVNNGFGNYIYLPFHNLKNHGKKTIFVDESGNVYQDQLTFLKQIQCIAETKLDEIIELNSLEREKAQIRSNTHSDSNKTYIFVNEPIPAILSNCEYLEGLRWKAKEGQHLEHAKRIYFANVFLPLAGEREWVIDLFSCLSDFDLKKTEDQLNSLNGIPTLCSTMCKKQCNAIKERGGKSPFAFAVKRQSSGDNATYSDEKEGRTTKKVKGESRLEEIPPFPENGYIGIANTFADLHTENSESPKVFYYCSFLTYLGGIFS